VEPFTGEDSATVKKEVPILDDENDKRNLATSV